MKLNIIIPTYNRGKSLRKTLESIDVAKIPAGLEVEVAVIDNNSSDETRTVVEELIPHFKMKLEYVFEARQGKSFAFNTGVLRSDGELFSGIDDDIEIADNWLIEVEKIFRERWNEIDFAGGKMLPNWEVSPPDWIKPLKDGVISWRDYGEKEWFYDFDTPLLTGGHAVFKREVFNKVGMLPEQLGPVGKSLIVCEDDVLFDKLMSAKLKGIYSPKLVFYHYVPAYRLSKSYYRQWCFGIGAARYLMDIHYKKYDGARFLDIPKWMYREFLKGFYEKLMCSIAGTEEESLSKENLILIFAGFFYTRHLQKSPIDKFLRAVFGKFIGTASK